MNHANLQRLIDLLTRVGPEHYDITTWRTVSHSRATPSEFLQAVRSGSSPGVCGTVACIGGWCETLMPASFFQRYLDKLTAVADFLEIDLRAARELCIDTGFFHSADHEETLRVLSHLYDTGLIDWRIGSQRLRASIEESYSPVPANASGTPAAPA